MREKTDVLQEEMERRRQTQAELLRSKVLLDRVLNSLAEGVVVMDEEARFQVWNQAAERIVGAGPTELRAEDWAEHYGAFDADGKTPVSTERLPIVRALRGESVDGEKLLIRNRAHPDGVWVNHTARPLLDEEGGVVGGVVVLSDVTEKVKNERRIRDLNEAVEERLAEVSAANAELDAFASIVSHDLRAPLRALAGFSVALREDYADRLDETGVEYLARIEGAAASMNELIEDLLGYSRLARSSLELRPVHAASAIEEALERLQPEIAASGAQVRLELDGDPVLRAHRQTLVRVVTNLVSNALKYVPEATPPCVRVRSERRDGSIRLTVTDNGIGIEPEHRERVFKVFERLHGTDEYPGTGIGLAVVAKGCERMGGSYGLESEPGEGSRFWVEFEEVDA